MDNKKINLLEKYKPKSIDDVIDNNQQITKIDNFIKQFIKGKNINNANLIVVGNNGIGKTLTIDLIIKKYNMIKITPSLSNISIAKKTKKKKKKEVNNENRSLLSFYLSLQSKKKMSTNAEIENNSLVVVFDDVSNISNKNEKEVIKSLVKLNNKMKNIPIIIISNTKHSKTVNEIKNIINPPKKKSDLDKEYIDEDNDAEYNIEEVINTKKMSNYEVIFTTPEYNSLYKLMIHICKNENIRLVSSMPRNLYQSIITHSQYDIRRMINILEELKYIFENEDITYDKFIIYTETSKTKDTDPGIFEATQILLNRYKNIDECLLLYSGERAVMPLMVHQNYTSNIIKQYPNLDTKDQIDIMFNISKCISDADYIEGIIYSNQAWNLQNVHGFYSCALSSYYINKTPDKMRIRESYLYTRDYNRTCIKRKNTKAIKKAQENFPGRNLSILDLLFVSLITKSLFDDQNYNKIISLFKSYKLTISDIESIIKIDKIKKKNNLTAKQRTLFKSII